MVERAPSADGDRTGPAVRCRALSGHLGGQPVDSSRRDTSASI